MIVRVGEGSVRVEARVPALRFGEAHGQSSTMPVQVCRWFSMNSPCKSLTRLNLADFLRADYCLRNRFWSRFSNLDAIRVTAYGSHEASILHAVRLPEFPLSLHKSRNDTTPTNRRLRSSTGKRCSCQRRIKSTA